MDVVPGQRPGRDFPEKVPRCFQWNAKCLFREGVAWFGRHRCAQPRQGRQVIAQRFIAGNDAPPDSPSPARGERNPRAFAANYRRPSDDFLSSLRDFGPSCTRSPPLKGWAILVLRCFGGIAGSELRCITSGLGFSIARFPLTPSLSLGERETRSPVLEVVKICGFTMRRQRCFPLPKGEG